MQKAPNGRKKGRQAGKVYCTALNGTCMNFPCRGRRTCRMHGGTAKLGMESHAYRGKGHSQCMPKRFGQRLDEALKDPNYLSQARRIGQMTARCEELWDRLAELDQHEDAGPVWDEFLRSSDLARRLIESERRRQVESQQVIAISQVMMMLDKLADIIRRNVSNPHELRAISTEFVRELGHAPGSAVEHSDGR